MSYIAPGGTGREHRGALSLRKPMELRENDDTAIFTVTYRTGGKMYHRDFVGLKVCAEWVDQADNSGQVYVCHVLRDGTEWISRQQLDPSFNLRDQGGELHKPNDLTIEERRNSDYAADGDNIEQGRARVQARLGRILTFGPVGAEPADLGDWERGE